MSKQVLVDPSDYPDWTRPVSIIGYTIVSLPIDIVAQTIGNISIDIAAQTLAQLNVNIAAAAVTLNVAIQSSAVTLNVAIQSSAVTINVATAVGEHVDTDIKSSIQLDINIAASAVTLNVDITAQTVGNLTIDIAAQSMGNLAINIAASAISLNVKTAATEHVDTDIVSSVQIDINIAASAVTLNVDITAQTVGNLNVNLAASAITLNVDIAAQTVDLNIKTSGGTNIVIDQLTQTAYLEDRRLLSNNGATPSWGSSAGANRAGKFFSRGCRGFIYTIEAYCKDAGAAGGTITVYIAPYIGAGYFYSANITVPAEGTAAWRLATFNLMWQYDSLFIWILTSSTDIQYAYDAVEKPDGYVSGDSGVTWAYQTLRRWFRAPLKAMTVGDLNVSGTLNVIEIPSVAARSVSSATAVPHNTETKLLEVVGSGTLLEAIIEFTTTEDPTSTKVYAMYVYADGNLAKLFSNQQATQSETATSGRCCCGEFVKLTTAFDLFLRMPIKFRRVLKLYALQTSGAQINCTGWLTPNLIK